MQPVPEAAQQAGNNMDARIANNIKEGRPACAGYRNNAAFEAYCDSKIAYQKSEDLKKARCTKFKFESPEARACVAKVLEKYYD